MTTISEMLDDVISINTILTDRGFKPNGTGANPWRNRSSRGNEHIDVGGSGWSFFINKEEVFTSTDHKELRAFLDDVEAYRSFAF